MIIRKQLSRVLLMSTGFLAVMPVTCHSIFAKRSPKADDGYEYVSVSGSRIPLRVKKGEAITPGSPVDVMSGEALRNYTQRNTSTERIGGGK